MFHHQRQYRALKCRVFVQRVSGEEQVNEGLHRLDVLGTNMYRRACNRLQEEKEQIIPNEVDDKLDNVMIVEMAPDSQVSCDHTLPISLSLYNVFTEVNMVREQLGGRQSLV